MNYFNSIGESAPKIQKPDKLVNLLKVLALQIGSEINFSEFGKLLSIDNETVEKYIMRMRMIF